MQIKGGIQKAVSIIKEMENRNLNIEFIEQPVHAKDWMD